MSFTEPRTEWPRQLRLAGQTPPVEGPVDLVLMYRLHHAFRRDLTAFTETVPATPATDRAAWVAMQQRWETFAHALHHHHSGEDAWLWPALAERTDDQGRETRAAMEAEHDLVDPALTACAEGL
ncbi:hemerythrin domain-containing protein, partial [Nocardioides sp.]|uniref:hemerythrin domain-containing protein n=1 Tax=Nocardioides sp. TaxID=35761 RepID=UPI002734710E